MSFLRSTSLAARLSVGIGFIILLGLISAIINGYYLSRVKSIALSLKDDVIPYALLADEMTSNVQAVQQFLTDASLTRREELLKEAEAEAGQFRKGSGRFRELHEKRGEKEALDRITAIESEFTRFYDDGLKMAQAYMSGAPAHEMMAVFNKDAEQITISIRALRNSRTEEANSGLSTLMSSVIKSGSFLWGLAILSLAVGVVTAILITRGITRPIRDTLVFTGKVAEGDLTTTIDITDGGEIGTLTTALNGMAGQLREMMGRVLHTSGELKQVSQTILTSSSQVAKSCEIQSAAVEETSSAIIQINSAIKGISHGVDSLSSTAEESSSSILQLAASIEEVALSTDTLAKSADGISSSTTEMTASIRQIDGNIASLKDATATTAVSVAQMESSIRQVEENAQSAAAITSLVLKDAEAGKNTVEATIAGINEIRRSSTITAEVVSSLSRKAHEIDAILSVIDEVAGQTNLLALNAAIIAAQAGEQGKGFSVVADEIKQLADRTSKSTKEIADLIKGVQEETERAVQAIEKAETSILDGEALSQKSGAALSKIVDGTTRATSQVSEIARATMEQTRGSAMIRQAMESVSDMISQIAVATAEQSRGSEHIAGEVQRMRDLTAQVKNSTREQNSTASMIARLTTDINDLIARIKTACDEQSRGSSHIISSAESIRSTSASNSESSGLLEEAVASLSAQINVLESEVARFKVD
jgi:methyl-accepting chemotaxis protein